MAAPVRITVNSDWAERLRQPVTRELDRLGERIANTAQGLCPVKTGALRASIIHEVKGFTLRVGSKDVPYSVFVEYGTSRAPAQPYLRPAIEQAGRSFR